MLGCHSFCFRDRGLGEALDGAARAGFARVELWHGHAPWTDAPEPVVRALREASLGVSAYCIGGFYEGGAGTRDGARRAFSFARALGVDLVTGCLAVDAYEPVARAAEEEGARFAVENHWYQALSTPADLPRALEYGLGLSLDTGHAILARSRPEEFVRRARGALANLHLKDVAAPGWRGLLPTKLRRRRLPPPHGSLPLGDGALDAEALAEALRDAAYAGPVAVEVEASPRPVDDLQSSLPLARALVAGLA